jgi:cbb3-type cytochrome oxidase maturation protein
MDILFLLVPFSVLLVLALIGLFAWALKSNQFDDLQREGERILEPDAPDLMPIKPRPEVPNDTPGALRDEEKRRWE